MTGTAIGYCRVSTLQQSNEGHSLAAQRAKVEAMASLQDLTLADVIVDDASAKNLDRPGMARLLGLVDARAVDVVIVAKLDRLTRSVRDLADLLERFERAGVALVSVAESLDTSSAAGRLVLNIMASVSQWEREIIGERTAETLRHLKQQGKKYGGRPPFGFRAEGDTLATHPAEVAILHAAQQHREKGLSYRTIARRLNDAGFTTRDGGPWHHAGVGRLLGQIAANYRALIAVVEGRHPGAVARTRSVT